MCTTKKSRKAKQRKPKSKPAAPIHARPRPPELAPEPVTTRAKAKPVTEAKPKRAVLKPMSLSDVITVVTPNPYRNGNRSWVSFNKYKTGMTVEAALKLGIPRDWLAWDRRYQYVKVEPLDSPKPVPTSEKPVGKRRAVGRA